MTSEIDRLPADEEDGNLWVSFIACYCFGLLLCWYGQPYYIPEGADV